MSGEFFSELDYSRDTIQAAMNEGIVEKWRVDGSRTQWYRSTGRPLIRAVPPAAAAADLGDDGFVQPDGFLDGDDDDDDDDSQDDGDDTDAVDD